MHWLKYWRLNYKRKNGKLGLSRREFAEMVRVPGTIANPKKEIGCSEVLIAILEGGGVTHPAIANRIAEVTGATQQQRDMLVNKIHRGTWTPAKIKPAKGRGGRKIEPMQPGYEPHNARPVVKVDCYGQALQIYASIREAAADAGCRSDTVRSRCERRLSKGTNEFQTRDFTWRYAAEWYAKDREARMSDIRNTGMRK